MPNKNTRLLHGQSLLSYTVRQAAESGLFKHIVVSTDSAFIAEEAQLAGAEAWFLRPANLATDIAPKIPAIRHALVESEERYGRFFDVVIDLDVTSPLRAVTDILDAYNKFQRDNADNLFTVCPSRRNPYFNMVEVINDRVMKVKETENPPVRRQDEPEVFDINASIYIWKREVLLESDTLYAGNTSIYEMPEERSIDIDSELDWSIVEFILSRRN